jgi:hypothetical protein
MSPSKSADPDVSFDQVGIAINQQDAVMLPAINRNTIIQCDGKSVKVYNRQWQLQQTLALSKPLPTLKNGNNTIIFDGRYSGENGAEVKLEIRANGISERITAAK